MRVKFKWDKELISFLILLLFISLFLFHASTVHGIESVGFGDEAFWLLTSREIVDNNWVIPLGLEGAGPVFLNGQYQTIITKPILNLYLPAFFYSIGAFNLLSPIFSILTISLVFFMAREFYGKWTGIISVCILISVFIFIEFSILAYTDLPVTFFLLLSLYSTFKAIKTDNKYWLLLACLSTGLSLELKRTALFLPFIYLSYIAVFKFRKKLKPGTIKKILIILFVGGLFLTPYFVRNYINTGNPVYSRLNDVFGCNENLRNPINVHYRSLRDYNSLFQYPLEWFNPFMLGAVFQFLIIPGIVFIYFKRKEKDFNYWLLICITSYFIFPIGLLHVHSIRYTIILIPLIAISIGYLLRFLLSYKKNNVYRVIIVITLLSVCLYNFASYSSYVSGMKQVPKQYEEVYSWVRENTPENSVINTPFKHNTLLFTGRQATYQDEFMSYMKFWEVEKSIYKKMFEKYKIDYLFISKSDFINNKFYNSTEIIKNIKDNSDFKLVFENEYINVYDIRDVKKIKGGVKKR